jgi:hypothetical protein
MVTVPPSTTETIEVWGEEFTKFKTLEAAIANFRRWVEIGIPDIHQYRLWDYVPTLSCYGWGFDDIAQAHALELTVWLPGNRRHRFSRNIDSRKLQGLNDVQICQFFIDLMDSVQWIEGYFDIHGNPS